MHILITGAAGMIGRKLTARLVAEKTLDNKPIDRLTLLDVGPPERPGNFAGGVDTVAADIADPAAARAAFAGRPDVIFHLAAVVSGEAELDFEKGVHVNFDGSRALLEAIRAVGDGYRPRFVFSSSIAVFGAPFPKSIPDDFALTPLTSYGTQKAMVELMLADYTRRGFRRRRGHPIAEHRRAAGQTEQGRIRLFFVDHSRAAQWRGGRAAGR